MDIKLEPISVNLKEVNITANHFVRNSEAPLSLQIIRLNEIEKIPGANRDISKVLTSFAGVASPTVFRNDIMVRGGGPSENSFYLDGIEIPNINHFSTQGASGGPVGIINADLLREVDFYSGGFPVDKRNGISSVLDFKLKDGSLDKRSLKFTLGASEAGLSSNGPINDKINYQLSVRYSYLQFLFSVLNMPFLPRYIDGQFKVKARINPKNELTILGIGASDNMKLNDDVDSEDEEKFYIYQNLPIYRQRTYTVGAIYKHYANKNTQTLYLSHSYYKNLADKDASLEMIELYDKELDYKSTESQTRIKFENVTRLNLFKIRAGVSTDFDRYTNNTFNLTFQDNAPLPIIYDSKLNFVESAFFASSSYESLSGRFTASLGLRTDFSFYSAKMNNPIKQLAPRASASYNIFGNFYLNGNIGRYFQLPSYTAMGYKDENDIPVNKNNLKYIQNDQFSVGVQFRNQNNLSLNADFFYKKYSKGLYSIKDSIPVACLGSDFGIIADEEVLSIAD